MRGAELQDPDLFPEWLHVAQKIDVEDEGTDQWRGGLVSLKRDITGKMRSLEQNLKQHVADFFESKQTQQARCLTVATLHPMRPLHTWASDTSLPCKVLCSRLLVGGSGMSGQVCVGEECSLRTCPLGRARGIAAVPWPMLRA